MQWADQDSCPAEVQGPLRETLQSFFSFVSSVERNFRLTQGAFARNRGTSSTIEAIQDINGDMRNCDGEGFDLGCYE
ncbi:MAG: hypothetical protein KIT10_02265 [Flavobacteriales bacterium]|nr:hypothetical protein [Flavobacteriales bacterium]